MKAKLFLRVLLISSYFNALIYLNDASEIDPSRKIHNPGNIVGKGKYTQVVIYPSETDLILNLANDYQPIVSSILLIFLPIKVVINCSVVLEYH